MTHKLHTQLLYYRYYLHVHVYSTCVAIPEFHHRRSSSCLKWERSSHQIALLLAHALPVKKTDQNIAKNCSLSPDSGLPFPVQWMFCFYSEEVLLGRARKRSQEFFALFLSLFILCFSTCLCACALARFHDLLRCRFSLFQKIPPLLGQNCHEIISP